MGDGKTVRGEDAATPQHDIEVERARTPSLPAPLPTERLLDRLQVGDPLTEFFGVLTGNPRYTGAAQPLLDDDLLG